MRFRGKETTFGLSRIGNFRKTYRIPKIFDQFDPLNEIKYGKIYEHVNRHIDRLIDFPDNDIIIKGPWLMKF